MKVIYLIVALALLLASCNPKGGLNHHSFTVNVDMKGIPAQTVTLELMNTNDIISVIDSVKVNAGSAFTISGFASEMELYRLHFADNHYILLLPDADIISISGDWSSFEGYAVEGSVGSLRIKEYLGGVSQKLKDCATIGVVIDTLKAKGKDSLLQVAQKEQEAINQGFTQYIEYYADTTPFEPLAIFASKMLNPTTEINYLEGFAHKLAKRFPTAKLTKDYQDYFEKVTAKIAQEKGVKSKIPDVNTMAPEFTLPDSTGKMTMLSSLAGSVVLVRFWSSANALSRIDNKKMAEISKKYNALKIVHISLDLSKKEWLNAIKEDKMDWSYQLCDFKGVNSEACLTFGISNNIPYNFLINEHGVIIGRDLKTIELDDMIAKLLKK